ncbi:hypothetical protein SLEP1_g10014 [Rubroshorea leprosula]|uniref:PGG domain-containing protein n=1 Tax=Rubroshorea leprosula TaxID=152421 RepID=A0AAV5ICN9_9ROSI|nr:hypothetical protein SLEP1_g10014 [Rubroshorea leprosula]
MHQPGQSESKPEIGVGRSDGKEDKITEMTHYEESGRGEEDEMTEDSSLVELRKSICNGDWNAVRLFFVFGNHPLDTIILSNEGSTALHVAILAAQYKIAEHLIEMMSETDLEKKTASNSGCHTALTLVAMTGRTHVAKCIVQKNNKLLTIESDQGFIPVTAACAKGHKEMTNYLYAVTPPDVLLSQNGRYGFDLLKEGMDKKILVQSLWNCGVADAMFEATKQGIVEFVVELLKVTQPLIFHNDDRRHVFMIAIQYRQENIFNLLYSINEEWRAHFLNQTDRNGNNILHVAGEMAPPSRLARVSSPVLQMQRELQWFKEVERIVPEWCKESKNNNGETPSEVFSNSHEKLVKEGEKWIRDTASSFIVVGTLIITIAFAAAITLPGGNAQNGFPNFSPGRPLAMFITLNAISFFTASTSVLIFLGILASRFAQEDFLEYLPELLGLLVYTILISIMAMMASFFAAVLIILQHRRWVIISITMIAIVPVTFVGRLRFHLLFEILFSTHAKGIPFNRKKGALAVVGRKLIEFFGT